jgi:hypothetical protein
MAKLCRIVVLTGVASVGPGSQQANINGSTGSTAYNLYPLPTIDSDNLDISGSFHKLSPDMAAASKVMYPDQE